MIRSVRVRNFRSIADTGKLPLGRVTVLFGRNNSGKSSLLRGLYLIQSGSPFQPQDRRLRSTGVTVRCELEQPLPPLLAAQVSNGHSVSSQSDLAFEVHEDGGAMRGGFEWLGGEANNNQGQLAGVRPHHFVFPVLARRKSERFSSNPSQDLARHVGPTDHYLPSRIAALTAGTDPAGARFRELLERLVGVPLGVFFDKNGLVPGRSLSEDEHVWLDNMGEGVSGIVAFAAELATLANRLWLIEEPETDLHPTALRELLDALLEAVEAGSQLVVSTHSDVVLRHLASLPGALVYRTVLDDLDGLPTTSYLPVEDSFDRLEALAELGYLQDVPKAWLVFEESSAERFVKDLLIPLFVPRLRGMATVSADGASKLAWHVEDLSRVVLFVHLHDPGVPRAWVFADGDEAGRRGLGEAEKRFKTWPKDRFVPLHAMGIEAFYPQAFLSELPVLPAKSDRKARMRAKGALVEDLLAWADAREDGGRADLEASAGPLITELRRVEAVLAEIPDS